VNHCSDQLRQNVNTRQLLLNVHMADLTAFDSALAELLAARPAEYLPRVRPPLGCTRPCPAYSALVAVCQFEAAVAEAAKQVQRTPDEQIDERAQAFQVTLEMEANAVPIRSLTV
jgi:hypothetical protein